MARSADGHVAVIVPSRRFGEYLATMCGLIRRYSSAEPTVALALLHLLDDAHQAVADAHQGLADGPERVDDIAEQARLILADAERAIVQAADLVDVHDAAYALLQNLQTPR